jgi:hypothetical protein
MIMIGQAKRLSEPLRWGRWQRTAVAVLVACALLSAAALLAYGLTRGAPARADCIDVTFASTLGAARLHACGHRARAICAMPGGYRSVEDELRTACRRAGFPFAAPAPR